VGGGVVGCETGLHLARHGREVTILEELDDILTQGISLPPMNQWMLRDLLAFNHVRVITGARFTRITDEGAVVRVAGDDHVIPTDTVIVAIGYKSNNSLFEELKKEAAEVFNLGDSRRVRNIRGAIWDAYEVARSM
jgi:2-enoate reductase